MNQKNLFPEHLLIESDSNGSFTTSLKIAEHFQKQHRDVLKIIRKVECSEEFSLRNFAQSDYKNKRGKTYPMYKLTKDGFMFLAMAFTGEKAAKWKEDFINQFNFMDDFIAGRTTRFADALYQVRPWLKPIVEGTELGQSRLEIGEPLGKSVDSVTYHRSQAKRFGLLPDNKVAT